MAKSSKPELKTPADYLAGVKVHPFAAAFPLQSMDEFDALTESVKIYGVRKPIVMRNGEVADGRNRIAVVNRLNEMGIKRKVDATDPETGATTVVEVKFSWDTVEFEGTDSQLLDFVKAENFDRRQMSASQKAVAAVQMMKLGASLSKSAKGRGETATGVAVDLAAAGEGDPALTASVIGKMFGVNRTYIFRVLKIGRAQGGWKALTRVLAGEMSLNDALDVVTPEGEGGGTGDGKGEDVVYLDANKNAVPEEFEPHAKTRDTVKDIVARIDAIRRDVESMCAGKGGDFFSETEITGHLKTAKKLLSQGQFHTICPHCKGSGKDPENPNKPCPVCKRAKFISEGVADVLAKTAKGEGDKKAAKKDKPAKADKAAKPKGKGKAETKGEAEAAKPAGEPASE